MANGLVVKNGAVVKERRLRILISLPKSCKQFLDDLRRLEGVTASGYIRMLLEIDMRARNESGWSSYVGWRDSPEMMETRKEQPAKQPGTTTKRRKGR